MANMSYCRFENTLGDLRDCYEAMEEPTGEMSEHEKAARLNLFKLVRTMAREIGESGLDIEPDVGDDPMGDWHGRNE